ncbi:hypothetical protein NQ314_007548, partial [Rhamnusium bicolor]
TKVAIFDFTARPSPPGKPQLISEIEVTPDLVTIRWTKPINDGGSPISGYLVEHRRTGSPHWVRATPVLVQFTETTISGLEPGWRYQFRISAQNAVGISDPSELSEPITVTLQRSAITAPRFTQELQDTVALENEKSEFVVHFLGQPAPKVCWFKDGFEIFSSRRIRILTESDRSVLTIHQSALSDEGEIKCTATNRAGHVSTKCILTVEAPPSIRLPRQYEEGLLFEIGEMIRLKVSVAGRPTPLVFWSHNGESIKNNDRYEVEHIDKSSILKVNEAQRNDRGEYQVKAVNKLGEDNQSFLVTVTDKPSPPGKARVVMALGRSVTLSWNTPQDDGGCKIGNYIVEYYRLGWNVWLKAATSRQLTTMLGDLIEGSEYKFRVKAESPYGVSDPSEETEVVFIPDPKRGILQPQTGQSQPKDIVQEVGTPVVARRKNKPRSPSSTRVEQNYKEPNMNSDIQNAGIPKRPERNKIKSPPKTPEISPPSTRRETNTQMNKQIFESSDRLSMARELAYGSPEIKMKKEADLAPSYINNYYSSSSEKSRTPSPAIDKQANHKIYTVKIEAPKPPSSVKPYRSPSPELQRTKSPRENNENFTGSSEFMLVLYPDENERGNSDFEFDENSVPPPMSLSAPELGAEPPLFYNLRNAASSTELLHERAMMRFYQAAEAEEAEMEKRRKANENRKQIGLERQHSIRRRMSAGGISQQQVLSTQRRHSLRNSTELLQSKLHKFPTPTNIKREIMMSRQRSESEEKEEQAFEHVRKRMVLQGQSNLEKRRIAIVEEDKWAEDYVSSTDEDSEISDDEKTTIQEDYTIIRERVHRRISYDEEEENDTYHPGSLKTEPFEILTKRKEPPDPNFIPKPILKKTDYEENLNLEMFSPPASSEKKTKTRSHSPMPQNITQRERSKSLAEEGVDILLKELLSKHVEVPEGLVIPDQSTAVAPGHNISAIASISGITAASIVIPQTLLEKKKDAEEAKVVIDHYGDIVKNYGQRRKSNPKVYLDRDSLKRVAENVETPQTDTEDRNEANNERSSFTDHYDSKPRRDSLKINQETNTKIQKVSPLEETMEDQNNRDNVYRRSSITDHYESTSRRDSLKTNHEYGSKVQKVSPLRRRERTLSRSPPKQFNTRDVSPRRSPSKTKLHTKSPVRPENWNTLKSTAEKTKRKTSPSPMRKEIRRKTSPSPMRREMTRKTSPSPLRKETRTRSKSPSVPHLLHRPMLREIMTQTSVGLESFDSDSYSQTSTPYDRIQKHEALIAKAEIKVRSAVDYITDLAMFVVACWLYLFKNELLAIPVLLVMVYRQLQIEIAKRIPKWILRRLKRKKK